MFYDWIYHFGSLDPGYCTQQAPWPVGEWLPCGGGGGKDGDHSSIRKTRDLSAAPRLPAVVGWVDQTGNCRRMGHLDLALPFSCTLILCASPTLGRTIEMDLSFSRITSVVWRPHSEPMSGSSLVKTPTGVASARP